MGGAATASTRTSLPPSRRSRRSAQMVVRSPSSSRRQHLRGVTAATAGIDRVAGDHMGMCHGDQRYRLRTRRAPRPPLRITSASRCRGRRALSAAARFAISTAPRRDRRSGPGNPSSPPIPRPARSAELKCDIIFKATKVYGIYTADPEKDPKGRARPHGRITVLADAQSLTPRHRLRGQLDSIYIFRPRKATSSSPGSRYAVDRLTCSVTSIHCQSAV